MEYIISNNYILLTAIFLFIVVSNFFLYKLLTRKKTSEVYKNNVSDTQHRVTPKPGRRTYKLACGIECYQEELTWDQDVAIMNILSELKLNDMIKSFKESGDINVDSVISIFSDHDALQRFMDVLLTVTYTPPGRKWKFYNSELRVIFTDFFTLNPESKMILEILRLAAGITLMKDTPMNSNTKADQT